MELNQYTLSLRAQELFSYQDSSSLFNTFKELFFENPYDMLFTETYVEKRILILSLSYGPNESCGPFFVENYMTTQQARKILGKLATNISDEELEKEIKTAAMLKNLYFNHLKKVDNPQNLITQTANGKT